MKLVYNGQEPIINLEKKKIWKETIKITSKLFLDIHAIQTLPPANINRGDTGGPRTAQYGGVTRTRVSSQSWKRAMRTYFNENGDIKNVGIRSLEIISYVTKKIVGEDSSLSMEETMKMAEETLNKARISTKDRKAKALSFLSDRQTEELAQVNTEKNTDKNYLQGLLKEDQAIDVALFGRMVADDPSLNADVASRVVHATSIHAIGSKFDFFTAVGDLAPEDNAGARMLGTIEYNSSTLYRYANAALHEFFKQLKNPQATINTTKLFVETFIEFMPTGKINTFANQALPQAVVVSLRLNRPLNMVGAFEESIRSSEGYIEKSVEELFDEYEKYDKILEKPEFIAYLLSNDFNKKEIGKEEANLNDLSKDLKVELKELIED